MTNREYMINLLLDGLKSRLNRVSIDDDGASEEAMIYYNINCPYYAGDKRAYCRKEGSLVPSREVCVACKAHWLEARRLRKKCGPLNRTNVLNYMMKKRTK